MALQIARQSDFLLPLEAVTRRFGIMATSGSGKSYLASVMAEEMYANNIPFCVIDPNGAWWGMRYGRDGASAGIPLPVLGGDHGDLPLTEDMGERLAQILAEHSTSMVLDLSGMRKGAQKRFVLEFAEALLHFNRSPLHLIIDESDRFAPERATAGDARLLGAMQDIAQRGRSRGIGSTWISQRVQFLSKTVLELIETMIVLRTIAPKSQAALREWVSAWDIGDNVSKFMTSLATLPTGTAWVWSPEWLKVFRQIEVRERNTFDSGVTPKLGERIALPNADHPLDLNWLAEALALSPSAAQDENQSQTYTQGQGQEALLSEIKRLVQENEHYQQIQLQNQRLLETIGEACVGVAQYLETALNQIRTMMGTIEPVPSASAAFRVEEVLDRRINSKGNVTATIRASHVNPELLRKSLEFRQSVPEDLDSRLNEESGIPETSAPTDLRLEISRVERQVLDTLASYYPMELGRYRLALFSGYSPKSSSFVSALSGLKSRGLMRRNESNHYRITQTGLDYLGVEAPQPKQAEDIRQMWLRVLPNIESLLLRVMIDHPSVFYTSEELAVEVGYSSRSSSFISALSALVRHGFAVRQDKHYRVSQNLF